MSQDFEPVAERKRTLLRALTAIAAVLLLLAAGWAIARLTAPDPFPGEGSPEAGFARDMQVHHAQAVDMSMLIRDRTGDADVRRLAYDIARSQQQQAGQMHGWLAIWGLPQASPLPAMAWISDGRAGHDMAKMAGEPARKAGEKPLMPGMADAEDLNRLEAARGTAAERLYLELMIDHHKAGVAMANAVLERTDYAPVENLARSIQSSQQSEIKYLTELLETR